MPRRQDIKKVLIIGSGPIIIGQAAEFDFSGSQASRSLREEGFETIIVNSNPATIQTDLETADIVYIEPLTPEILTRIIEKERPQGILPGFGGQTGLNLAYELSRRGVLEKLNVELLGSNLQTIELAENREYFRDLMKQIGEPIPRSFAVHTYEEARSVVKNLDFPLLIRPAYTLGGTGSSVVYNSEQLYDAVMTGLTRSPIHQVLIEESVLGWKEFEYEVMRDNNDNCIIICSMENIDPMGVHTGESMVVAPAQTLSDKEHQILRASAIKIIRALKIAGGCNIQFAVNPDKWEYRVIEVNPRVSRSSALASKATGYPIARVSAKIAVGFNLDEIPNAITKKTMAGFEPALDYVVVKIPRWPFDKFPTVDRRIGTQMKSTGEVMAIGSTIEEALLKAIRSLEIDKSGLEPDSWKEYELIRELQEPTDRFIFAIAEALRRGYSKKKVSSLSKVDEFFITKIENIVKMEKTIKKHRLTTPLLIQAKKMGFGDEYLSKITDSDKNGITDLRLQHKIFPKYNIVDTCAGEFEAYTPYYYSTYWAEADRRKVIKKDRKNILIVGSGPIRIGQGIEFDYCCVHSTIALKEMGYEAIIINNNPETVSTDFDISTRLYFEPLRLEDVLNVIFREDPYGVILQFGGQTSVNLAMPLYNAIKKYNLKTKILGTSPIDMHRAEDREAFSSILRKLNIFQPPFATGYSFEDVRGIAKKIGYPVLVRPSYVLGGRGMEIIYDEQELEKYIKLAVKVSPEHPILVDKYIANATEVDVDALCDGEDVFIAGIMEHIEQAGVHSGDSYCVMPPRSLSPEIINEIKQIVRSIALALNTIGLINIQLAIQNGTIYVLEANPRASRTVPYVSKTIGIPLAKIATRIILGCKIKELNLPEEVNIDFVSVKGPVFPFLKLPGVDPILGPEMKSTGEVMAVDKTFGAAYYKAILADNKFASSGTVYITVRDEDKKEIVKIARELKDLGFKIVATRGTAQHLKENGIEVETVYRISEHKSPNALDLMKQKKIDLIINTPSMNYSAKRDGYTMRRLAVELNIPFITALNSAYAEIEAIKFARQGKLEIRPINELKR
ncbi:MAG: carbamoyl-phosphate synthase large subunit [candidate division WOR-3 bacterium]|nr:carbamoyl-phosphate synthase large subunit [candidate division WOR-3 bacterium]